MDEHMQRRLDKQKKLFNQLGIHLDALSIHEKEFNNKLRGYDPDEVNSFLDEVIKDYERFYATIADLMDKWQEQQIVMRDLKVGVKPDITDSFKVDPRQLENIIIKLEDNIKELKTKVSPEQHLYID
ncbi:DivIVA domain-containing protein [Paenibacillus sp. IHBB 10380]|uniref:DivIVA domain-containing protein n=1 Tax=Paenibacillus sp. IHBB 10380 TaxID=1566358 RepID=UPI0005CFDA15|nr:DivIVA domain-containing protein [Paenibacillus sp. IHBB 10380]AJS59056.1 cell division protein [Paenibacillus sp. IHBB 10380]